MKREPDPAARRVEIEIGEKSRLVIDQFDDYDELVEAHIYWDPGVRAGGYVLPIGEMVTEHNELEMIMASAFQSARIMAGYADQLQPHSRHDLRDVEAGATRIIRGLMADDHNLTRRDARRVAVERSRRRGSPGIEELRALVDYWNENYDGDFATGDDRKAAAAEHFNWSVRTLDDRLRQAKRAGLEYRGMRP